MSRTLPAVMAMRPTPASTLAAICFLCSGIGPVVPADSGAQEELRTLLEGRLRAWSEWVRDHTWSSDTTACQPFYDIVAMGPPVVPLLMERLVRNREASGLGSAVLAITWKTFPEREWPKGRYGGSRGRARLYVDWWCRGRKKTRETFETRYARWKELKARSTGPLVLCTRECVLHTKVVYRRNSARTALGQAYREIEMMGIDLLPLAVEKFGAGDHDLLPIFAKLTQGLGTTEGGSAEQRARTAIDWWERNKQRWLLPPP